MELKLPNWKITIALLVVTTIFNPILGIGTMMWLFSGFLIYKIYPIAAPILLYGAAIFSIVLFVATLVRHI